MTDDSEHMRKLSGADHSSRILMLKGAWWEEDSCTAFAFSSHSVVFNMVLKSAQLTSPH